MSDLTSSKKLLELCESWEQEARNRWRSSLICDEKKEGPVTVKQAFQSTAIICWNHSNELRSAIQPKSRFDFLFKIFAKNRKSPGTEGD